MREGRLNANNIKMLNTLKGHFFFLYLTITLHAKYILLKSELANVNFALYDIWPTSYERTFAWTVRIWWQSANSLPKDSYFCSILNTSEKL